MRMVFVAVSILLVLTGCQKFESNENQEDNTITQEFLLNHSDKQQKFKIISAYKLIPNYINEVENQKVDNEEDYIKLFHNEVIAPVWEDCFENGEYIAIMDYYLNHPKKDIEKLKKLSKNMSEEDMEKEVKHALEKSAKLLNGPDTNVCILPSISHQDPAKAVNVGKGKITVLYKETSFKSKLDLASTIAHEYHHSVWTDKYYDSAINETTLIDVIMFEGKAETFKKMVYPEAEVPEIEKGKEEYYWEQLKDSLNSTDPSFINKVMIGGGGTYPFLYGYGLGYRILDELLDNNDMTVEEWTEMEPENIIKQSNFESNF